MKLSKTIRKFEDEYIVDFTDENFRGSVLEFYKKKIWFEGNYGDLLCKRHLAIEKDWKYIFKNSAILLFAENPESYIPSSSLRYIRYDWNKLKTGVKMNVIKDERFEGNIPRIIELIKRFLNNVFRDYYYLDLKSWKFIKISEYPEEAWLEWIVNALTHRSYNLQWNVIYIKHFDDRLEISNSWPLPLWITINNIREKRYSRNPRIARVLSEMWYVRELNEGVKRIYESMKESLLVEPEYQDEHNMVTLILRNNISRNDETISEEMMQKIEKEFHHLNKTQKDILTYLLIHKSAIISDFVKNLKLTIRVIRKYLNQFIKDDFIIRNSELKRDIKAQYKIKDL